MSVDPREMGVSDDAFSLRVRPPPKKAVDREMSRAASGAIVVIRSFRAGLIRFLIAILGARIIIGPVGLGDMAAPYLLEVRTGADLKEYFRKIIYEIEDEFGVKGAAQPRAVPHITLFGPYNTKQGKTVKRALLDIFEDFEAVPYRVEGFDTFRDNNVIYARVVPSQELRDLRREIARRLEPITFNTQPHDAADWYDFHITLAYKDVGDQFRPILNYLEERYTPSFDAYATRVTSLRRRDMLWEYDLPRGELMGRDEATTRSSWEATMSKLEQLKEPDDHENLATKPGFFRRLL